MLYKDLTWVDREGKRPKHWERIPVDKLDKVLLKLKEAECTNITATIQTYYRAIKQDGEDSECDFFADFDKESKGDVPDSECLQKAYNDCIKLAGEFIRLGIDESYIYTWFSGRKGFHLVVPRQAFGAQPDKGQHVVWRTIAQDLKKGFSLNTLDITVYNKARMWRVENTVHGKSGLYKIPILLEDLFATSIDKIKSWAETEQPSNFEKWDAKPYNRAKELFARAQAAIERYSSTEKLDGEEVFFGDPPPCIAFLLKNGVTELHTINMTMFRLAAYFKSQDVGKDEAISLLNEWVLNIKVEHSVCLNYDGTVDIDSLRTQVLYVTQTVYASEQYGFSCAGIKQIPGIEELCTEECKAGVEKEYKVSLFDATKVEHLHRRLSVVAEAVGRADKVLAIPHTIEAWCNPTNTPKCNDCPLRMPPQSLKVEINARRNGILEFIEPSQLPLTAKVGKALGLPDRRSRTSWKYKVKEQNCETISIAPRVTNEMEVQDRYVRETSYFIGHGLVPNTGYKSSGYSHIRTRTNEIVLVIDKAEPLADTLEEFNFTDRMKMASEIFRPKDGQSIKSKHSEIIDHLNYNTARLWGRDRLLAVVDLTFHSVNKFWFQDQLVNGWMDVLIIGDTAQGKTEATSGLINHYDLGIRISGESASRTGILYTIENEPRNIVWGFLPRYNKRLVVIDEISSLVESGGFAELTDVRSKGVVTVARAAFGKAAAETRTIWMTNTVGRKGMGTYGFPVLSIPDLIPHREDIRRFTLAIGVCSGEIDDEIINLDIDDVGEYLDIYDSETCHNHLLWVWNLKSRDVVFDEGVEQHILKLAYEMCQLYIPQIPLVDPGDFRYKLARVSCAVAARMDSRVDNKLMVTKEHVNYAWNFINELYTDPSLKYRQFSVNYAARELSEERMDTLRTRLEQNYPIIWAPLSKWLLLNPYTKGAEFATVHGYSAQDVKNALTWFAGNRFLEGTSRGHYRKTELGVKFFEYLMPDMVIVKPITAEELSIQGGDDF